MGILGEMLKNAVVHKIEKEAMYGVVNHMEKTRSVDAIVQNTSSKYILFIKKKTFSYKRSFTVVDEEKNNKYTIKTQAFTFGFPSIYLYDTNDRAIGRVELESKSELGMGVYVIYLGRKKLGRLKRKTSLRMKFDFDYKGWHLDGDLLQNRFEVTDKNGYKILDFTNAFSEKDTYVLELYNYEYEVIGLLLVMAVEIAIHGND